MGKTLKIIRREYIEIVRKKSFLIGLFLMPIFIVAIILLPVLMAFMEVEQQKRIAVIDLTDGLYEPFVAGLEGKLKDGRPEYVIRREDTAGDLEAAKRQLAGEIDRGKLNAYLLIPADIYERGDAEYYGKSVSNLPEIRRLRDILTRIVVEHRLAKQGLDAEAVREWTRRVKLEGIKIVKGKEERSHFAQEFIVSFIFMMILYMMVILYGVVVMRGVLEEKSSRMVEVLLSSVRAEQLMVGKIVGIGGTSLTQVIVWAAVALFASAYGGRLAGPDLPIQPIGLEKMIYFSIFFVLGYLLYATLYAIIGAVCTSEQDAQHVQMLVILPLIVPMLLANFIIRQPDAPVSVVLSLIPFFSPILMFMRINILTPSLPEIAGSILLLIATIAAVMWAAARIYRAGILMYGKRATLPEILRWLKKP